MIVLGVETSCDETSCSLVDDEFRILSNSIYSQLEHSKYGGIVPEVASRQQIKKIVPIYYQCLEAAGKSPDDIDAIAVTCGPGLIGSLLVGVNFAKGIAYALNKTLIGINHLEGHICSNYLEHHNLHPPFVSLVVSGGHTLLVLVKDHCKYQILGQTRDDAAGEAYDKVAKLLGLGYPGGSKVDELARNGDSEFYNFPRAVVRNDPYAFSFSGIKTAVAIYLKGKSDSFVATNLSNICASFQQAVLDSLIDKCLKALIEFKQARLAVVGGVAANSQIRKLLNAESEKRGFGVFFPSINLCTDNGAMIAAAGHLRLRNGELSDLLLDASAQLPLDSIA